MLFWKKTKAREIKNDLKSIRNKLIPLVKFERKIEKTRNIINKVKARIEDAKQEILERAEEEKAKPWLDSKFDFNINKMAEEEIKALEKLAFDLQDYGELVALSKNQDELNDVVDDLLKEEAAIAAREKQNKYIVLTMQNETLDKRLRSKSITPPARKTSDGVSWIKISKVGRELGGWVEKSGNHPYQLIFPSSRRPIPFSSDINSKEIAKQIRAEITHLPPHKVPNAVRLERALKAGDLRLAV